MFCKMAALRSGIFLSFTRFHTKRLKVLLKQNSPFVQSIRTNFFFKHIASNKYDTYDYKYEVTRDPDDWQYVERLLPLKTIPEPTGKSKYPSGWRPATALPHEHPYFVERSKNHLLSVYLENYSRGQLKITELKRIRGDIWLLYEELRAHIQEQTGRKIPAYVHEANGIIKFKGDYVYYVEQWLLSKGF